jgi:hypothetical protein
LYPFPFLPDADTDVKLFSCRCCSQGFPLFSGDTDIGIPGFLGEEYLSFRTDFGIKGFSFFCYQEVRCSYIAGKCYICIIRKKNRAGVGLSVR